MDFKKFFSTYSGMLMENRMYRWVLILLLISNLVLVVMLQRSQTVVLVPPLLKTEAKIGLNHADRAALESWGLFFVQLMGNVTPRNIDFIMESLQRYMAPDVYQDMTQAMYEQAKAVKSSNLTMSFNVQEVAYDESSHRVKVKGQAVMRGPYGKPMTANRTYDLAIDIKNYTPVLTALTVLDQAMPGEEKEPGPRDKQDKKEETQ
ncbi:TraE/TraK family type IV conjugative transfer system protein [Desulfobacca acetoxidans]|nr:hypothetical protein [Desulfobacterales bacterium]